MCLEYLNDVIESRVRLDNENVADVPGVDNNFVNVIETTTTTAVVVDNLNYVEYDLAHSYVDLAQGVGLTKKTSRKLKMTMRKMMRKRKVAKTLRAEAVEEALPYFDLYHYCGYNCLCFCLY